MMKNTVKENDTPKKQKPTGTDPAALEPAKLEPIDLKPGKMLPFNMEEWEGPAIEPPTVADFALFNTEQAAGYLAASFLKAGKPEEIPAAVAGFMEAIEETKPKEAAKLGKKYFTAQRTGREKDTENAPTKRKAAHSPVILKEPQDIQDELSKIRLTQYEVDKLTADYNAAHPKPLPADQE